MSSPSPRSAKIAFAATTRAFWHRAGIGLAIVAACLPLALEDYNVFRFTLAVIWSIAILGMVVLAGISGQFSIGHSAFYGIGGYSAAIMVNHAGTTVYWGLPVSVAVSFAIGYLFGRVAARLTIWHQALATLSLAIAFPQFLKWSKLQHLTGGVQGFYLDPQEPPAWLGVSADRWWYILSTILLGLGMVLAVNLIRGRWGRALKAVRDHDMAAAAQGIDVAHVRAMGFAVSAAYVGLAGCLAAILFNFVAPGTYTYWLSTQFLVGLVVGGMNAVGGAVIGGLFLQFMPDLAAAIGHRLSLVLYGVLLIAVVVAMPRGVAGVAERIGQRWLK